MFLKRLELQGFKSFADKVQMCFKPGITIVVGPNGSGKSNIADAIRWVLGEQSVKSLRGNKMEDIIFSGSEKRRPLGMAEVSLTIDNTSGLFPLDYSEVTVTRRLYRSGESDFLINNVPCRLKDIHEMFMDTGIGREGFSIIGQGKVDEVLNTKPEERRLLIEEAAGIVKYRYRKKEATKKLEETEQNLIRVKDIISELNSQIGPLSEQSAQAEKYLTLQNKLERIEVSLIVQETIDLNSRIKKTNNELITLRDEHLKTATQFHNLEAQVESDKLQLSELEEKLRGMQERYYQKNSEIEKSENETKLLQERFNSCNLQEERIIKEIEIGKQQLKQLQQEKEILEKKITSLQESYTEYQLTLKEHEKKLIIKKEKTQDIENKIEIIKSDIIEILNEQANLRNKITIYEQQKFTLEKQKSSTINLLQELNKSLQYLSDRIEELIEQDQKLKNCFCILEERIHNSLKKVDELNEKEKALSFELRSMENQYSRLHSRHSVLEEMEEKYHGYFQGVKEILLAKNVSAEYKGVHGTVAQILTVPVDLETAIETVLGGALQNIITDNESTAQTCINYLKNYKKGRATFLPLTTIKSNTAGSLLNGKGILGRAVDLVEFDSVYKPVMEYLLGKVWLVDTLKHAVQIGKETGFKHRLVTLEGDLVSPGGSLTGGQQKNGQSNLLSRKREIENLKSNLEEFQAKINNLNDIVQEIINEKNNQLINLDTLKKQKQEIEFKKLELIKDIEQNNKDSYKIQNDIEVNNYQVEELKINLQQILKEEKILKKDISLLDQKKLQLEEEIKLHQSWLSNQKDLEANENTFFTDLKIQTVTIKQNIDTFKEKIYYLDTSYKNIITTLNENESEAKRINAVKQDISDNIKRLELLIKELFVLLNNIEVEIVNLKANKEEILEKITDHEKLAKNIGKKANDYVDEIHNMEIKVARLEIEFTNNIEKLQGIYGLTLAQGKDKIIPLESKKAAQSAITKIKEQIDLLGIVNIAAIEEFKRVKERLDFLSQQVIDLDQAKESLYKVINEMNRIMIKKFKETYIHISEGFSEIFKELFGGGKAELILTDEENLLETGLEIMAQPMGKKTQSLSLLSGGERALTAICLLLAILKYRPSPFCVLDEIEAALDEANVARFAQYIKGYTDRTQFICISHRKGTMEIADVLYGVTIEETGVSKMVAVELTDVLEKVS